MLLKESVHFTHHGHWACSFQKQSQFPRGHMQDCCHRCMYLGSTCVACPHTHYLHWLAEPGPDSSAWVSFEPTTHALTTPAPYQLEHSIVLERGHGYVLKHIFRTGHCPEEPQTQLEHRSFNSVNDIIQRLQNYMVREGDLIRIV